MRSLFRIVLAVAVLALSSAPVIAANCEGGSGVPQQWESTFRYYNSSSQLVGWEVYTCDDFHIARGTLNGVWMEETDIDCCTGQQQHAIYYWCPLYNDWYEVAYVGDTNCS